MNLIEDLNFLVTDQLCNRGCQPRAQDNSYVRFCMYYEHSARLIAPIPRQVEISSELMLHKRYNANKPVITEIINRLQGGEDLTPYLSKGVAEFNSHDQHLLYWGNHHLHLSPLATIKNGFVKRSDDLLFVRVEKGAAYLIDILPHADPNLFVQKRVLEIVDNNWPNLHREVFGITGESLNPDEIKGLRKHNANTIEHVNNRSIMPTMGVTAAGTSMDATYTFDRYQIELSRLESEVRGGADFSDSPLSGSLAQPKPWRPRHTEEQAHEKDQKEPRTCIQSQGGNRSNQGRQDAGRIG